MLAALAYWWSIEELEQKNLTKVAAKFNVSTKSLRRRIRAGDTNVESVGPPRLLDQEEEALFVSYITTMASLGWGYDRKEVLR